MAFKHRDCEYTPGFQGYRPAEPFVEIECVDGQQSCCQQAQQTQQTFDAKIKSSTPYDNPPQDRWVYEFVEVEKKSSGYGGWDPKPDGRSGSSYNKVEDANTGSGKEAPGYDVDNNCCCAQQFIQCVCAQQLIPEPCCPVDFTQIKRYLQPATPGSIVSMSTVSVGSTSEYWFQWENAIDCNRVWYVLVKEPFGMHDSVRLPYRVKTSDNVGSTDSVRVPYRSKVTDSLGVHTSAQAVNTGPGPSGSYDPLGTQHNHGGSDGSGNYYSTLTGVTTSPYKRLIVSVGVIAYSASGWTISATWGGNSMNVEHGENQTNDSFTDLVSVTFSYLYGGSPFTGDVIVKVNYHDSGSHPAIVAFTAAQINSSLLATFGDADAGDTGSGSSPDSTAATNTYADEVVMGNVVTNGPDTDLAGTWGGGFTAGQRKSETDTFTGNAVTVSEGYLFVNAIAGYSATKTGITSRKWNSIVVTFA